MIYLTAAFKIHPYLDEIVAMPVVGIYWYHVTIRRADMPEFDWEQGKFVDPVAAGLLLVRGEYFEACTAESDQELTNLVDNYLAALAQDHK